MTREDLWTVAQLAGDAATSRTAIPDDLWEKLEAHARDNWSCDPASLIRMGIQLALGLETD